MFPGRSKRRTTTDDSCKILSVCHLVACDNGTLHLQPLSATLTTAELAEIIRCLSRVSVTENLKEIVFDLRHVEVIGPQWTVVLAMLIDFARRLDAKCRLISLNEQPAAAASLYRRSAELMKLITWETAPRLSA
jgi:anti-anti-sigma regulatory factor